MKTILIRVAIILFVRWLKKNKPNSFLAGILEASTRTQLINTCECNTTATSINAIVADIEDETTSGVISDIIGK